MSRLSRAKWWVLLIRGILAILFGILAFMLPSLTLVTLVLLFGCYAFLDGLTALIVGGGSRAWSLVLAGVLGILIGVVTFVFPGVTAVLLLLMIAAWAIVRGLFEIIAAVQLRKEISNEWLLGIGGIISIIFGLILIARPAVGALAVVWLIGAYAFVFGIMMVALAFRLRGLSERARTRAA